MKNTFKLQAIRRLAGIIALLAIVGFSMAACSDNSGSGDVNLAGTTWKWEGQMNGISGTMTLTFTASTWQLITSAIGYPPQTEDGTYTISGNKGTIVGSSSFFVVNGSKLTLTNNNGTELVFTKQP